MSLFLIFFLSSYPSKHTTSFGRLYNVHNVKTTSYGRQNNVVCVLGFDHKTLFVTSFSIATRFSIGEWNYYVIQGKRVLYKAKKRSKHTDHKGFLSFSYPDLANKILVFDKIITMYLQCNTKIHLYIFGLSKIANDEPQ